MKTAIDDVQSIEALLAMIRATQDQAGPEDAVDFETMFTLKLKGSDFQLLVSMVSDLRPILEKYETLHWSSSLRLCIGPADKQPVKADSIAVTNPVVVEFTGYEGVERKSVQLLHMVLDQLDITQSSLADLAKLSTAQVSGIITGKRPVGRLVYKKLVARLNMSEEFKHELEQSRLE